MPQATNIPIRVKTKPSDHKKSLAEAKKTLRAKLHEGTRCECCGRTARIYRRPITSIMSRLLIELHKGTKPGQWIHIEKFIKENRHIPIHARGIAGILRFWGLIRKNPTPKKDGNPNNGIYQITARGRAFATGKLELPKYVIIYDNEALGFVGEPTKISDTLGKNFNYRELMRT
jgi:hypothetical protein